MGKNVDARIIHSKAQIFNALNELLKEKPFQKITVIDICEKAHINRMTFYNHYQDKYDLFNECINVFFIHLGEVYFLKTKSLHIDIKHEPYDCLKILIEILVDYAYDNEKVLFNIVVNKGDDLASFMLKKALDDAVLKIVSDSGLKSANGFPLSLITSFFSGGVSSVFGDWITKKEVLSKEDFTEYLCRAIKAVIDTGVLKKL